jgi:hypothetical protein
MRVDVFYPRLVIQYRDGKQTFKQNVRSIVGMHMDGVDYTNQPINLAGRVNVMLLPYELDDALVDTMFSLVITGHDYPSRMLTIEPRLKAIEDGIRLLIFEYLDMGPQDDEVRRLDFQQELVSVTFLPYPRGCYTSSKS